MGNSADHTEAVTVIEKLVPVQLKDDNMPQLKVDLDGNGKNIKNIKDIECKTINGIEIMEKFETGLRNLLETCQNELAKKNHTHPEFTVVHADIQNLASSMQPKGEYAASDHSHDIEKLSGTLPLSRIKEGERVLKVIGSSFAEKDHRHIDLENRSKELSVLIQEIKNALISKKDANDAEQERQILIDRQKKLSQDIEAVRLSIPTLPEQDYEMVVSGYFIVPRKASGLGITELSSYSLDGLKVNVDLPFKVGDKLKFEDFYKLPADTLVRIRVK